MLSHLENCNQDDQAYLQAAHTAIACTQSRLSNNHQLLDQQLCGGDYVPPITMPSATPQLHPNIGTNGGEGGHVIGHYSGLQHYQNSTNSPPMDYRQSISEDRLSKTNIYIRGLPKEFNDQDLSRLCQSVGRIRSLKAIMDKDTNRCKGYGFVDFETSESAISALKKINSSTNYHAQMAKQQEQDPTNLYFANLSSTVNEVILEDVLAEFGQVISARILRDNNTRSKGVGFARMETKEICDNIIDALNGKKDSSKRIIVLDSN
ncbi:hypothetical protein GJ496_004180 [Pomphorhynchus laevis]|nr:hypothetical protein GJ496_004180 [Pomphorhynchus laevis]